MVLIFVGTVGVYLIFYQFTKTKKNNLTKMITPSASVIHASTRSGSKDQAKANILENVVENALGYGNCL